MRHPHPDITTYPDFIIDATGIGFVASSLGGAPYHFIKGLYSSPNGRRLAAAAQAVRVNAPRLASVGAAYLALVETFHYVMIKARKKDDFWSYVLPSFAAGAFQSVVDLVPSAAPRSGVCALPDSARDKLLRQTMHRLYFVIAPLGRSRPDPILGRGL